MLFTLSFVVYSLHHFMPVNQLAQGASMRVSDDAVSRLSGDLRFALLKQLARSDSEPDPSINDDDVIDVSVQRESKRSVQCTGQTAHLHEFGRWVGNASANAVSMLLPSSVKFRASVSIDDTTIPLARSSINDCDGSSVESLADAHIHDLSLCPWEWTVNYDPMRIPAKLPEARCKCARPMTADDDGTTVRCEELRYTVRVLKYTDQSCTQYTTEEAEISVACIAIRQPAHRLEAASAHVMHMSRPLVDK